MAHIVQSSISINYKRDTQNLNQIYKKIEILKKEGNAKRPPL